MARSTETLYQPNLIITDQFDFYSLYDFKQPFTKNFCTEVVPGADLYSHVAQYIRQQKIGLCIKDDVYRGLTKFMLGMDEIQWRMAQIRQNRARLADAEEIIIIALKPGYMRPEDLYTCEQFNQHGVLQFVSIKNVTPAYQKMPA